MSSRRSWIATAVALALLVPGCTSLFTKQAIERFAESLAEQDLDSLKVNASEHFGEKALRHADAAKGLKMLKLPAGKIEIVSVEEVEPGLRKAVVKIGEKDKAKELEYRLSYNRERHRWLVDDIVLKQDSGGGQIVERLVTEQMDLLLTCRELLITWREDDREKQLSFCDEDLKTQLQSLPETWFNRLAHDIAGPGKQSTFKPEARLKGDRAFVIIPHVQGSMFLEMKQSESGWQLHDLAIEPSSKDSTGIRNLTRMVAALNQSASFLKAYSAGDRDAISRVASANFYEKCLAGAELEEIPLPTPVLLADPFEARQFTDGGENVKRVELLLRDGDKTFMLTLRDEEPVQGDGTRGVAEFRVDEVTMFEKNEKEVKRMSSVFLSHAVVNLYVAALRSRDITKLKELSSSNFSDRVWNRPEAKFFAIMPEPEFADSAPQILTTVFRGDTSEVTIALGETPMTLLLQLARGWMVVDDVLLPAMDRPTSLKANLEVMLTVHAFVAATQQKDLAGLIKQSADGLDRIVWRQLTEVPPLAQQLVMPMLSEVVSVKPGEDWTIVRTIHGDVMAEIKLVKEGEVYTVHDVSLINTAQPEQRLDFLQTVRQMIAAGQIGPAARRSAQLSQAPAEETVAPDPAPRQSFQPIDPAVYEKSSVAPPIR